jgi:hypothetical protein
MSIIPPRLTRRLAIPMALCTFGLTIAAADAQTPTAQSGVAVGAEGLEILARGPVHEAYAKPANASPEPSKPIAKAPPEPIEELPPDQKPEGEEVEWIPGYWAWDEDHQSFDWISGFWREAPPGRDWVPGHWQEIDQGWVWVSGYWGLEKQTEILYLPAPPPLVEDAIPAIPAPSVTSTYVTGIWVYHQNRYLWRPGFWIQHRPGWVWNPASYIWTPNGYVFIDGYWDHPFDDRGLLFAPVRFGPGYFAARRPFTPAYVVRADFLFGSLFIGPAIRNYFFGDYFDNRYVTRGYIPWPDYRVGRIGYDPNFNYYRHSHAGDATWETGLRDLYLGRRTGNIPRPPTTLVQQNQLLTAMAADRTAAMPARQNFKLTKAELATAIAPIKDLNNTPITGLSKLGQATATPAPVVKLAPVSKEVRERDQKAVARLNQIAKQRKDAEDKLLQQGSVPYRATDPARTVKVEKPQPVPRIAPQKTTPPPAQPPGSPPPVTAKPKPQAPMIPQNVQKPVPNFTPPKPPAPPVKRNELPKQVDPPKKNDPPMRVDPPKKVDPPMRVDPPKKVDPPKQVDPPKKNNPPKKDPPKKNDPPQKKDPPG